MLALTILGNNSAIPAFGRNPTAQVLQTSETAYMIDCGEGTQNQIKKYKIKTGGISHIFISHLHGDHYFGLMGLLASLSLTGRTQPIHLFAPPLLKDIIDLQLKAADSFLCYPLHFHPLEKEGNIMNDNKISVSCFKVTHRIECWGFLFREIKNPRSIDPERAKSYEIPSSFYKNLQKGEDYVNKKGTIIPNEEVTVAATPAKSYAYCADTVYDESIIDKVKNVDLLYHETTYLKALEERAVLHFHSTTQQAGRLAKKAEVKRLLIGHFSSKYEILDEFLTETCCEFEPTALAIEGMCFKI